MSLLAREARAEASADVDEDRKPQIQAAEDQKSLLRAVATRAGQEYVHQTQERDDPEPGSPQPAFKRSPLRSCVFTQEAQLHTMSRKQTSSIRHDRADRGYLENWHRIGVWPDSV